MRYSYDWVSSDDVADRQAKGWESMPDGATMTPEDIDDIKYKATERYSYGWNDPRKNPMYAASSPTGGLTKSPYEIEEMEIKITNLKKDKALLIEELEHRKDMWRTALDHFKDG